MGGWRWEVGGGWGRRRKSRRSVGEIHPLGSSCVLGRVSIKTVNGADLCNSRIASLLPTPTPPLHPAIRVGGAWHDGGDRAT